MHTFRVGSSRCKLSIAGTAGNEVLKFAVWKTIVGRQSVAENDTGASPLVGKCTVS